VYINRLNAHTNISNICSCAPVEIHPCSAFVALSCTSVLSDGRDKGARTALTDLSDHDGPSIRK
jgi:hypothetical protein